MATTRPHEPDYRSPQNARMSHHHHTPDLGAEPAATQLDFYQAMADFKHMFPNMDEEVIEAVLRSNSGAVDATIDQLLTMNSDIPGRTTAAAGPASGRSRRQRSSSTKSSEDHHRLSESAAPPPYPAKTPVEPPPPSYQDYTRSLSQEQQPLHMSQSMAGRQHIEQTSLLDTPVPTAEKIDYSASSSTSADLLGATGGVSETTPKQSMPSGDFAVDDPTPHMEPPPAPMPQLPDKMPLFNHDYTPRHQLTPKRLYKGWNPPLLGRLPDDFLRITISNSNTPPPQPECHHCHHHISHSHSSPSSTTMPARFSNTAPVMRSKGQRSQSRSSSQASSPRPSSTDGRSPRISPRGSHSDELSSELLQQKMVENERKRLSAASAAVWGADPATLQLLEDERMALIIQNEEFLAELMGDEDFMRTLERDHMNATAFEPPLPSHDPAEFDPDRPKADYMEGYGDDRDVTLGAFPFDRNATEPKDKKAEFRRKLNNMGGSSKKKMLAAARKFFQSRKKKSSKQLLKENTAPSTANLLEEEEVYAACPPGAGEPSPHSHVSYGKTLDSTTGLEDNVLMMCYTDGVYSLSDDRRTEIM